ncbi:MAG: TetR/AcrR family transcriptional regulator [Planctomycetota bacterium]
MDTKTQILDAAEALFAEQGFDATSLRAVTACAGVNLAAVNYHFGSKDGLLQAVCARRIGPVNDERMARLDEAESQATDRVVPLDRLLEIFLLPALRLGHESQGTSFLRVMGRLHGEMDRDHVRGLIEAQFATVKHRFVEAFRRTLPELPDNVLIVRIHFLIGSMAHTMMCPSEIVWMSGNKMSEPRPEELVTRLVAYAAAGLRAPVETFETVESTR